MVKKRDKVNGRMGGLTGGNGEMWGVRDSLAGSERGG